jgi:hypothetical protein
VTPLSGPFPRGQLSTSVSQLLLRSLRRKHRLWFSRNLSTGGDDLVLVVKPWLDPRCRSRRLEGYRRVGFFHVADGGEVIDESKWCALCERDGHGSIDCPFEKRLIPIVFLFYTFSRDENLLFVWLLERKDL